MQSNGPLPTSRLFGSLSDVSTEPTMPLPTFDIGQELLLVESVDDANIAQFYKTWRNCGLDIKNHFILPIRQPTAHLSIPFSLPGCFH